jgi:hypothetical protein
VGAFPVWRPNLDELDVDSAPASAFLIPKSFKIIPLQLGCRVPVRVLACLLSDGPVPPTHQSNHCAILLSPYTSLAYSYRMCVKKSVIPKMTLASFRDRPQELYMDGNPSSNAIHFR